MKTFVLMYDNFAQFEVILTNYFCKAKGEVITVCMDDSMVTSLEGFQMVPHKKLSQVNINEVDLFVIPGGDPEKLYKHDELYEFIKKLEQKDKLIAAICAAPIHLAKAGVLNNKKYTTTIKVEEHEEFDSANYVNENVIVDGNIITAKATGYVDFAIEIGKVLDIYENEEDLEETIKFFKYFKS